MKALASVVLVFAICVSVVLPSSAAGDDRLLTNVRGNVSLDQGPGTPSVPIAPKADRSIAANDYAVTGGLVAGQPSQGAIVLPDSTRILVGQNTRVQMKQFDQVQNLTTANFALINGKIRFIVQHPGGAKANYTFSTSTGQIAVRGTEGDVGLTPAQLQVNVYEITDPKLPVVVTMNDGKVYTLNAGQTLTIALAGAVIAAGTVAATTESQTSEFSEFGTPAQAAAAAGALGAAAASGGIPAIAAVAAGAVALGGVIVGTGGKGGGDTPTPTPPTPSPTTSPTIPPTMPPTPTPTPMPTPTPTSIPICIGAAGPIAAGGRNAMQRNAPRPAPTASCPPTPMIAPPAMPHPVVRPPQPRPVGPQPPYLPIGLPGHPTPPPMPGAPPNGTD